MAAIIGVHGDNQGLILPNYLAPYQVVIIPITNKKDPLPDAEKYEDENDKFKKYFSCFR